MSDQWNIWSIWLDTYGFIYKGVLIIPCGEYDFLLEYDWEEIDSTIKGML